MTDSPRFSKLTHDFIDNGTMARIGGSATRIYLSLLRHADPTTGECWPSKARVTAASGVGQTAFVRALKILEAHGLVVVDRTNGGLHRYTVLGTNQTGKRSGSITNQTGKRSGTRPENGPEPDRKTVPRKKTHEEDPLKKMRDARLRTSKKVRDSSNGKPQYLAEFNEWYSAYPRHVDRRRASEAYPRAVARLLDRGMSEAKAHGFLAKRARAYAASRIGEDPKFTQHPTSWLNGDRFDDDLDANGQHRPANVQIDESPIPAEFLQ